MTTSAEPELHVDDTSVDVAPRRQAQVASVEALVVDGERAANLLDLIHRSVDRNADRPALRWKLPRSRRHTGGEAETDEQATWREMTYREAWDWIRGVSLGLQTLGVKSGDRICIVSRTRPAWLVADLAGMALGAVTCPIYPSSEANQAAFIINNVGATLIVVENAQQAAKIESIRAQCPTLEKIVVIDERGTLPEGAITFDDVLELAPSDADHRRLWDEGWRAITRDNLATIIHTSGTTANPKGAMLTHGNLVFNYEAVIQVVDFYETDIFLSWLPLSHIYERVAGMVVPLGRGSLIAYAEPLIERLPINMAEVRPTVMVAVPRLYERVYSRVLSTIESGSHLKQRIFWWAAGLGRQKYANHLAGRGDSLWLAAQLKVADLLVFGKIRARTGGRVRYFVSGSAPLAREIGEFFFGMGMLVLEGYGLTETSPFVSINRPGDFVFGTVGKPAPDTEVRIDAGTGEILVRGPQVMRGYLNDSAETARAIDPDGWFHTGDIGELDDIGRIRITDRLKNIIVLANGKNVSPAPMEAALSSSKYIGQAVILGDLEPYTGALIAPDFDELSTWAAANGLAEMPPEKLIEERSVQKLIDGEVKAKLDGFAIFERPRRVALLPRLLTEEEGELTPSMKVKVRIVKEKWASKVAELFEGESKD
ncbi:MAG TPA: long-chain fatty acid--CoA ligase [Candidatus Dormibacteraeota bacterium]|nr:long-chain fatty acid--CoA ligase [Candidatus Dormibacteraeota bacterium]